MIPVLFILKKSCLHVIIRYTIKISFHLFSFILKHKMCYTHTYIYILKKDNSHIFVISPGHLDHLGQPVPPLLLPVQPWPWPLLPLLLPLGPVERRRRIGPSLRRCRPVIRLSGGGTSVPDIPLSLSVQGRSIEKNTRHYALKKWVTLIYVYTQMVYLVRSRKNHLSISNFFC